MENYWWCYGNNGWQEIGFDGEGWLVKDLGTMNTTNGGEASQGSVDNFIAKPPPITWRGRLMRWMWPERHADWPGDMITRDGLATNVTCSLSMMDRLRLLWSGRLRVEVRVTTENLVGAHKTASAVYVMRRGDV